MIRLASEHIKLLACLQDQGTEQTSAKTFQAMCKKAVVVKECCDADLWILGFGFGFNPKCTHRSLDLCFAAVLPGQFYNLTLFFWWTYHILQETLLFYVDRLA